MLIQTLRGYENKLSLHPEGQDPLLVLDPKFDALAYLFIINRRLQHVPNPSLIVNAYQMALQIEMQHNSYFLQEVQSFAATLEILTPTVEIATTAVNFAARLSSSYEKNVLSVMHDTALYICLCANCPEVALPILTNPVTDFDTHISQTSRNYLRYCYYAGLLCLRLRNFDQALDYFMMAQCVPSSSAVSSIEMEAEKKMILVSLIRKGRMASLPAEILQHLSLKKVYSEYIAPYRSFGQAVESMNFQKATQLFDENLQLFKADENEGLVKICLQNMVSFKIMQLTKIYISLSVDDIAGKIDPVALALIEPTTLREKIVNMIKAKKINASIDGDMVFFKEETEVKLSKEFFEQQLAEQSKVIEAIQQLDKDLGLDKKFLLAKGSNIKRKGSFDDEKMSE